MIHSSFNNCAEKTNHFIAQLSAQLYLKQNFKTLKHSTFFLTKLNVCHISLQKLRGIWSIFKKYWRNTEFWKILDKFSNVQRKICKLKFALKKTHFHFQFKFKFFISLLSKRHTQWFFNKIGWQGYVNFIWCYMSGNKSVESSEVPKIFGLCSDFALFQE